MNATITVTEIENGDVIDGLGLVLLPTETRPNGRVLVTGVLDTVVFHATATVTRTGRW